MSAAPAPARHLIDRLPPMRGRLSAQAPLAPLTWFRVGGPADVLFRPADAGDLADFLAGCPSDVPVTVVGVASNLLIRDGGVRGVVVRLPPSFAEIRIDGDLVAVHRTPEVRNRQIVVARLDNEVTVKRYRQEGPVAWLLPENEDFEPIKVDLKEQSLLIEGVVVALDDGDGSHWQHADSA
jgi:hypothetical protein